MATAPSLLFSAALLLLLLTHPIQAKYFMYSGEYLSTGGFLDNGPYRLVIQDDCNLVLYEGQSTVWASNTDGHGRGCYLAMQTDGNLVVYTPQGAALWASGTDSPGQAFYVVVLQNDRNVVIYGGGARWATGTNKGVSAIAGGEGNATVIVTKVN